jgi:hypothetical protein
VIALASTLEHSLFKVMANFSAPLLSVCSPQGYLAPQSSATSRSGDYNGWYLRKFAQDTDYKLRT